MQGSSSSKIYLICGAIMLIITLVKLIAGMIGAKKEKENNDRLSEDLLKRLNSCASEHNLKLSGTLASPYTSTAIGFDSENEFLCYYSEESGSCVLAFNDIRSVTGNTDLAEEYDKAIIDLVSQNNSPVGAGAMFTGNLAMASGARLGVAKRQEEALNNYKRNIGEDVILINIVCKEQNNIHLSLLVWPEDPPQYVTGKEYAEEVRIFCNALNSALQK